MIEQCENLATYPTIIAYGLRVRKDIPSSLLKSKRRLPLFAGDGAVAYIVVVFSRRAIGIAAAQDLLGMCIQKGRNKRKTCSPRLRVCVWAAFD